jgi:predicted transcriptional regulator
MSLIVENGILQEALSLIPSFPFKNLICRFSDKTDKLPKSKELIECYSRVIMQSHRMQNDNDELVEDHRRQRLRVLFSALSNRDCLRVFKLVRRGTVVSEGTLQKLKLSERQYYRKLKQLSALGLIMKDETRVYRLTPLGEIVYQNQVVTFYGINAENDILEFISQLIEKNKPTSKSSSAAISDITHELLAESNVRLWNLRPIRLFETIDEYDSNVVRCVLSTKSELYLATRSLDLGTIQAVLDAAARGAKINMVYTDWKGFYSNTGFDPLNDLLLAAGNSLPGARQLLQGSPSVSIHRIKIPYSFVVADKLHVAIEIADPEDSRSFFAGVGLESSELATKLVSYYDEIVKHSQSIRT